jgi:hypothetical protein
MPNKNRKRSNYVFTLSNELVDAFLELAKNRDEPLEQIILAALDKYIETEKLSCQQKK